jgi:phage baseplate assembly protein gpV
MSGGTSGSRMEGLAIATVVSVEDPDGMGKIQLDLAAATGRAITAWAPIATMMAGKDRGTWMLPEIGDVAIVGFLGGVADHPYILGFMWNGADTPPSTSQNERMIRSLNRITIRMIDQPPPEGPNGALVIEDGNGNTITMSNAKITIKSAALLALDAPAMTLTVAGVTRIVSPTPNPI